MAANAEAHRPGIWAVEAWRGVAALMVLWVHWGPALGWPMGPMRFGFTGVDLFFVLSGFVFAPTVLGARVPALPAFAVRRAARIYPAYLAALALYAALAWTAGRPLLYLPEHLLMAHTQSREMTFYYNPAFWSLPSEVAFYALVPVLAACLGTHARTRWALLFTLALGARLAMIALADDATQNWAYLSLHHLPGLLIEFFFGVWVWQRQRAWTSGRAGGARPASWLMAGGALAGWLLLAALFDLLNRRAGGYDWRSGQLSLLAATCFAAMLLASLRMRAPAAGSVGWKLGRWGGRLSYSMYLLHIAWLGAARFLVGEWGVLAGSALAGAGLLASCWILHETVEEPARRRGRNWAIRRQAAAGIQKTSVSPG